MTLVEADEGLLVYRRGADPLTARWWVNLTDDERRQARDEAERYEGMSGEERATATTCDCHRSTGN